MTKRSTPAPVDSNVSPPNPPNETPESQPDPRLSKSHGSKSHPQPEKRRDNLNEPFFDDARRRLLQTIETDLTAEERALAIGVSRATLYRHLRQLEAADLIKNSGEGFLLTSKGRSALEILPAANSPSSKLEIKWPVLQRAPTPVHRAILAILLALHISRRDNLLESHHGAVTCVSRTGRGKSLIVRLACHAIGADPAKCVVEMNTIRCRGLLTRLNAQGESTYQCNALGEPILWLNEIGRADPGVLGDLMSVLNGTKRIKIENDYLPLEGVPFLEMNPRVDEGSIEEKLGFDAAMIRRTFLVDLSGHRLPHGYRTRAKEILEQAAKVGAMHIPAAPTASMDPAMATLVEQCYTNCVRSERLEEYVDWNLAHSVILGLRAVLPDREAVREGLRSIFTLYATVAFMKDDWEAIFCGLVEPDGAPSKPPSAKSALPAKDQEAIPRTLNPYSVNDQLLALREGLKQLGLAPGADTGALQDVVDACLALKAQGIATSEFKDLAINHTHTLKLNKMFKDQGISEDHISGMTQVLLAFVKEGVVGAKMENMLAFHRNFQTLEVSPQMVSTLFSSMKKHAAESPDAERQIEFLTGKAAEGIELQDFNRNLSATIAQAQAELERVNGRIRELRVQMNALIEDVDNQNATLDAIRTVSREEEREVERLKARNCQAADEVKKLEGSLALIKQEVKAHIRADWATLIIHEILFNPACPLDMELCQDLRYLLDLRARVHSKEELETAIHSIAGSGLEILQSLKMPDDELEAHRAAILGVRRERGAAEKELAEVKVNLRTLGTQHTLAAILVAALYQKEKNPGCAGIILNGLHDFLGLTLGHKYSPNPQADGIAALNKILNLGKQGLDLDLGRQTEHAGVVNSNNPISPGPCTPVSGITS